MRETEFRVLNGPVLSCSESHDRTRRVGTAAPCSLPLYISCSIATRHLSPPSQGSTSSLYTAQHSKLPSRDASGRVN